jgi:peptide deformylase
MNHMASRNIRNYKENNTILRKQSKKVENIDNKVLTLLEDMADTMYQEDGVGLAAPQVGVLKRLVVIDIGAGLIKLINPEIMEQSGQQHGMEGCLSVPGISGEVVRPQKVRIKAQNEKGAYFELEGTDLLARAICHEIDHLNGVLFIDKIVPDSIVDNQNERSRRIQ